MRPESRAGAGIGGMSISRRTMLILNKRVEKLPTKKVKTCMLYIKHHVGEMVDLVQRCIICGEVIADYRNVMIHPPPTGPIKGWEAGPLYISQGTNPTTFRSDSFPPGDGDNVVNCKSSGHSSWLDINDDLA